MIPMTVYDEKVEDSFDDKSDNEFNKDDDDNELNNDANDDNDEKGPFDFFANYIVEWFEDL